MARFSFKGDRDFELACLAWSFARKFEEAMDSHPKRVISPIRALAEEALIEEALGPESLLLTWRKAG